MSSYLWIKNGYVIDPANKRNGQGDVFAIGGKIVDNLSREQKEKALTFDATNLVVAPGLVDIHVHFREPGQTYKESIATGSQAAAAGGVTTVVCMPNTSPPLDHPIAINHVTNIAKQSPITVYFTGTLTVGRKGLEMAPIAGLKKSGVVALTDDGECIQDNALMKRIAHYAKMFNLPLLDHCQDRALTLNAVMHEGLVSYKLGLTGWPREAEDIIVARNILIAQATGTHIHLQHITSKNSVKLIAQAKKQGIPITVEATPHHLSLTDEALSSFDTNFKMNPPLRTESDRQALIQGIVDGTIDIISTDHAPHADYEKDVEMDKAPFGIIGLETLLPICLETLFHSNILTLPSLISLLTHKPAQILNLPKGTLSIGADADVIIFDPHYTWNYSSQTIKSRSHNSPWVNKDLKGRVLKTIAKGHLIYDHQ